MTWRRRTVWLLRTLALVGLAVGGYAFAAWWYGGNVGTISRTLLGWAADYPALPMVASFTVGVLFGHFWLPQRPNPATDDVPGRKG